MIYVKRKWDENRGDEFDYWGNSMWYFEVLTNKEVSRQIEEYDIGIRLRYNKDKLKDRFGGLCQVALDLIDSEYIKISKEEFEAIWVNRNPSLCQTIDSDKTSINDLEEIEIELPISDQTYEEIFSTGLINKLQHLPMKYGPIQDFEEAMILNEGLDEMVQIFNKEKSKFSNKVQSEVESIINFINQGKNNGKAIQFWL